MWAEGTNLPAKAEFIYPHVRTAGWYSPAEATVSPGWRRTFERLHTEFADQVRGFRPLRGVMRQSLVPNPHDRSLIRDERDGELCQCMGGLEREFVQLFSPAGHTLFGDWPIPDAKGKPIANTAGDPFAFRFGFSRFHCLLRSRSFTVGDTRAAEDGGRFSRAAEEAGGTLLGLPAELAKIVWRRWPEGFGTAAGKETSLWLDALHEMAWRPEASGPLRANRVAHADELTSITLMGDGAYPLLPEFPPVFAALPSRVPAVRGNPYFWISRIDDLARASVAAIELLLSLPVTDQPSRTRPAAATPVTVTSDPTARRITVLFLAANPLDQEQLRLDEEVRTIREMIRTSAHRDAVRLESRWAVRPLDVLQAINECRPQIIHFSGHGSSRDEIVFQDGSGQSKVVSKEAIVRTMADASRDIQLVFFNTCHSHGQAKAVVQHLPAAIGMNTSIGDDAARVFSAQFYSAIGFGLSVGQAFRQAKAALLLESIPEESTPELFLTEGLSAEDLVLVQTRSTTDGKSA